jgi:hypothetical protein
VHVRASEPFAQAVAALIGDEEQKTRLASPETERAVSQFVSEGLAAGEVIDVFELAGEDRPRISVLSDGFLDKITTGTSPITFALAEAIPDRPRADRPRDYPAFMLVANQVLVTFVWESARRSRRRSAGSKAEPVVSAPRRPP